MFLINKFLKTFKSKVLNIFMIKKSDLIVVNICIIILLSGFKEEYDFKTISLKSNRFCNCTHNS